MVNGAGLFGNHLNKIEKILHEAKLLSERNKNSSSITSYLSDIRKLNYEETWKFYFTKSYYDFNLTNNSLFRFAADLEYPSYTYLGCPYDCISYRDFLLEWDMSIEEVGESYYSDYEKYLEGCSLLSSPVIIRYDFDPQSYTEGLHPISHLHIGHKNQIRIGIKYILDPFSFFCFVVRQVYPDLWFFLIEKSKFKSEFSNYKEKIQLINEKFFNIKDNYELYLV